jgi:hypothetical protein
LFFAAAIVWTSGNATAADGYVPFEGEKTTWHEGFDRYDFIMDDATGAITPIKAPASEVTSFGIDESVKDGKRRCVVVVPKKAAPGNPWSWRGCYWNHQPQSEVELLKRGFHIAFVAPDPGRQGKAWDVWYKFLTENHGLAKQAAFVGMSKGGVNAFNWGGVNPDKVACIYADNPAVYDEDWPKITVLAKHDVPLLHVVGTEDFVLQRHTMVVENMYHQIGRLHHRDHEGRRCASPAQSHGPDADRGLDRAAHASGRGEPAGVRRFNLHQDALLQPRKFLHLPEGGGYLRHGARTGIRSLLRSL